MKHGHSLDGDAAPEHGARMGVGFVIPGKVDVSRRKARGVRGLRAQDHFLPLLVSATLLTTLALVFIAYLTVRADVLASQQQQVNRDVRIAQDIVTDPADTLAVRDGKLVTLSASGQPSAFNASAQLAHVRDLTGERVALYQLRGSGLVAVAADGLDAEGTPAPIPAGNALIADCGPLAPSSCHHAYVGAISLHDGTYTAAFSPLFDANDTFIGAIAVAQPQSAVLTPAAQFTIVLLFVGLLVTLVVLAAGVWTYNSLSGEVLDALHLRLNHLASVATELEHSTATQVQAAQRQARMARQISEGARDIDTLVNTMRQGHLTMHESASGVWAEMSQPGIAPDPAAAMRFARKAVVMAAHVGVVTEDARTRCNHVVRLMNQVIAEGNVLTGHGRETERRVAELREVIAQIERAISEPLAPSAAPQASSSSSRITLTASAPDEPPNSQRGARVARAARLRFDALRQRLLAHVGNHAALWAQRLASLAPLPVADRDAQQPLVAEHESKRPDATTRPPASGSGSPADITWHQKARGPIEGAKWTERWGQPASPSISGVWGMPPLPVPPEDFEAFSRHDVTDHAHNAHDDAELPRLTDLTRRLDRAPHASGSSPRLGSPPSPSSPSTPAEPPETRQNEPDDGDENNWRLP